VLTSGLLRIVDTPIRLWQAAGGREVRRLEGHTRGVTAVAFFADGRRILSAGGTDESAKVWDKSTGGLLGRIADAPGSPPPDGGTRGNDRVAMTLQFDTARLWSLDTGGEMRRLAGLSTGVAALAFSADRRYLLTASGSEARFWDLTAGREVLRLQGHSKPVIAVALSPDGKRAATGSYDGTARLWSLETGAEIRRFGKRDSVIFGVAFSPSGDRVLTGGSDATARLWDPDTGAELVSLPMRREGSPRISFAQCPVAFSPDGSRILTGGDGTARLWDAATGRFVFGLDGGTGGVSAVAFSSDGKWILTGTLGVVHLWDAATGRPRGRYEGHEGVIASAVFDPNGQHFLTGGWDGTALLWKRSEARPIRSFVAASRVTAAAFLPDRGCIVTCGDDGSARIWDREGAREACRLISFNNGAWAVIRRDGRFDSDRLEELRGLNWVFKDDPLRALPTEIFLRDYFEPRLLPRLLDREKWPEIPSLADRNRVQPIVGIAPLRPSTSPDRVDVLVEATAAEGLYHSQGRDLARKTGAYDLRLFRDGQLVGRWPEPADDDAPEPDPTSKEQMDAWRAAHRIPTDPESRTATRPFTVRLPHRQAAGPVEFTAYAFNEDRVKGETVKATFQAPANPPDRRPRAYLIAVGVSACQARRWDLRFAADDARLVLEGLGGALAGYEVVPVPLISERSPGGGARRVDATKANLKATLNLLAGRPVDPAVRATLPDGDGLAAATPDDLVIVSFSGHGYTGPRGEFYLVPYDVGQNPATVEAALPRFVSAAELAGWLRPVDAGTLALIVDACHSAAAVQQPGFKPGPFGSRGLGQLAYDKGMRVLAASQAEAVALESRKIRQGLLTYALVRDGLEHHRAEKGGTTTLGGLLAYAAERVPSLYAEVQAGQVRDAQGRGLTDVVVVRELTPPGKSLPGVPADEGRQLGAVGGRGDGVQRPQLFEYARRAKDPILTPRQQRPGP
jgi:WD40 repeat protein